MTGDDRGFVLMEAVVAIAVIAVLFVPVMSMFVAAERITLENKDVTDASQIAQRYMELMKSGAEFMEGERNVMEERHVVSTRLFPYITSEDDGKTVLWQAEVTVSDDDKDNAVIYRTLIWGGGEYEE